MKSRRTLRMLLITLLALIGGFMWIVNFAYDVETSGRKLSLDQVFRLARANQISSATLLDQDAQVVGTLCSRGVGNPGSFAGSSESSGPMAPVAPARCPGGATRFYASYPQSNVTTQTLIDTLSDSGAVIDVDKQTDKAVAKLVATFIFPLAMLANLFGIIFVSRAGESSIADIAGFGTIRRKRKRREHLSAGVSFDDVAGAEEAVAELKEVTEYLTDPERFQAYGASPPKGVLLYGPPGCGKTLLARAAAGETGVPFFSISGAEFVESLVGVGAARVRDLFRQVREVAPAIVFIDEIDAVGRRRSGEGMTGGEREQTVNQLLVEMDGFEVDAGIVVMAATNRPDILDPALLRPGRFDRHVQLRAPTADGRQAILEVHSRTKPMGPDVDFTFLAQRTPGFTGADLANVINEAALLALREGEGGEVRASHLSEAVMRVLHGPQRRGKLMNPEERRRIAYHEAGHAIVASAVGAPDGHQRVSILARGKGLGSSIVSEEADRVLLSDQEMEATVTMAFGGMAAELAAVGNASTIAEDDMEKATTIAREMVGRYGFSPGFSRMRVLDVSDAYLGGEAVTAEGVSQATLNHFDEEVQRLLRVAEQRAVKIVGWNRALLADLAEALEERETLEGGELDDYLRGVQVELDALAMVDGEGLKSNGTSAGITRSGRNQ